ncbi:MAG: efflux RND transporter permease subunit [Gammaproteobacteria bacterium]
MSLTGLSLRRPITTLMVFTCLGAIGAIAIRLLPLEMFPAIDFPGMMIQIPYEGSSPEEVEQLITRPVEEVLATMGDVRMMRSNSAQDGAFIFMFFGWDSDPAAKGVEARDKIDGIRSQLPPDVRRIFVRKFTTTDEPMLILRISSERDLSNAYELLERNVQRRLERLPGVGQVELDGVLAREISIELLADRVAAHGVDLNLLRDRLKAANFSLSAGYISDAGSGRRIRVNPVGEFRTIEEIRELPVGQGSLRLRDIAEVKYESPEMQYSRLLDRQFALGINVFRESGTNLVDVAERVLAEVEEISVLPEMQGIKLFVMFSQAQSVTASLRDLALAGLVGALMSFLVLFVFLRQLSTTLVVMLSVPCAVLITLGFMYFMGLTLNILSMMGLMLAIGMLVDNSVVITESIYRYKLKYPHQPGKATLLGVKEVALAVTAGTLTTVIVFLPNIFGAQNEITVFLAHVAYAITIALLASLVIAQTIIPMLTLRIRSPEPPKAGNWLARLTNAYARVLAWALRRRWLAFGAVMLILVSVAVPITQMKVDMFGDAEDDRIRLMYHVEGSYSLEKVRESVDVIEAYLYEHQDQFEIDSVYTFYESNRAESTLLLKKDREQSNEVIREAIRAGLPQIPIGRPSFEYNRSGTAENLQVRILGESSERLFELSHEVVRILSTIEGLTDVRSEATAGQQEVRVTVDRDRALQYGFTTQQVAQAISLGMRGENLREFRGPEGEIAVRLGFQDADRQTVQQLGQLPLVNERGERVTLATLADFSVVAGPRNISRLNRQTGIAITANLVDLTVGDANKQIRQVMDQFAFPPGYSWSFGEGFQREDETMGAMALNMLLAVFLIFFVMAALFESLLFPFSILTSILFSFIGVFWFFFLTGTEMSMMGMIGLLVLMGIVVNNGIVLIDHINNLRADGMPRDQAVVQGGRDRLRPILMTAATTILAMIPLAVGNASIGGGGPPYYPMARAIIGGLAFSTIVSLVVVPYVYVLLDTLRVWASGVHARAKAASAKGTALPAQSI